MDWTSISGILTGLQAALDHDENLAKLLYFKLLINSAITLVINDPSLVPAAHTSDQFPPLNNPNTANTINNTTASSASQATNLATNSVFLTQLNANRHNSSLSNNTVDASGFQMPPVLVDALIRLVSKYMNCLKDQPNLEYFYCSIIGSNQIASPISMSSGLSYLVNFLMPLLFHSASDAKDAPKLNSNDLAFVVSMLLNAVKPPSKLAATLLLQAPKQHHLTAFDAASSTNPASSSGVGAMLANQKSTKHMKDTISQSTFLAFKLVTYAFNKNIELTRIALSLRQMFSKPKTIYFWRFVEFTCMNKTPLFLLIKPFVEAFVASQDCETEQEQMTRLAILNNLMCTVETNCKSRNAVLEELAQELKTIQNEIQGL